MWIFFTFHGVGKNVLNYICMYYCQDSLAYTNYMYIGCFIAQYRIGLIKVLCISTKYSSNMRKGRKWDPPATTNWWGQRKKTLGKREKGKLITDVNVAWQLFRRKYSGKLLFFCIYVYIKNSIIWYIKVKYNV